MCVYFTLSDFVFQHVTFRGYCEAYNFKYANKHLERFKLIYKRVTEIFLAWRLAKYLARISSNEILLIHNSYINLDDEEIFLCEVPNIKYVVDKLHI